MQEPRRLEMSPQGARRAGDRVPEHRNGRQGSVPSRVPWDGRHGQDWPAPAPQPHLAGVTREIR